MQSFKAAPSEMCCHSSIFLRDDDRNHQTRFVDLGELDQPASGFHHHDAVDLSPSAMFSLKSGNVAVVTSNLHYQSALNTSIIGSTEIAAAAAAGCLDARQYMYQKETVVGSALGNGQHGIETWEDSSGMAADNSQQTDTSTDIDNDDRNLKLQRVQHGAAVVVDSMEQSKAKGGDQKTLRRLAQNREAARKSRLRKKVLVLNRHMCSSSRTVDCS